MIYIEECIEPLSPDEQSRIARELLLQGLHQEFGISEMPLWDFQPNGKPFFKDNHNIYFNISHCAKAIACFLSDRPVGIDVECINKFDKELAQYVSSATEFDTIINSPNPALTFTVLWTRKESFLKLLGTGLTSKEEIRDILTDNKAKFQTIINKTGGYVITSCEF